MTEPKTGEKEMEAEREELSPLEGRREEERAAEGKVLEQRKYPGAKPKATKASSSTTSSTRRTRQAPGYLKDYVVEVPTSKGKPTRAQRVDGSTIRFSHQPSPLSQGPETALEQESGLREEPMEEVTPTAQVDQLPEAGSAHPLTNGKSSKHSRRSGSSTSGYPFGSGHGSRHSLALSDSQTAVLQERMKLLALEEIERQIEEERQADERCHQLDVQARRALQEREFIAKDLAQQRRHRQARRELEEARMVSSFLERNEQGVDLTTPPHGPELSAFLSQSAPLVPHGTQSPTVLRDQQPTRSTGDRPLRQRPLCQ